MQEFNDSCSNENENAIYAVDQKVSDLLKGFTQNMNVSKRKEV